MIKSIKLEKINCGLIAFIVVISICSVTLFIKPLIGMADTGDYFRITSQCNLYDLPENEDGKHLDYFYKDYGIRKYYNEDGKMLVSTQPILVKTAVFLDKLITKDNIFDLRFLAFIFVIVHAVAAYLIVNVLTPDIKATKFKLLVTGIYIFIFCDTAYVAYFNSFYGEACFSFFLLSLGIILHMHKFKRYSIFNLSLFFISSLIFIGSKQQLAPIGILVAILFIRIFFIEKGKLFKFVNIGLATISVLSSAYLYLSISGDFDYINRYHSMTRGVLLYEWKGEELLNEFDINPQYSLLQETIYFNNVLNINPTSDKFKKEFLEKYSVTKVLKFYIAHPQIFLKMIRYSIENGYSIKNKVIGNYEKSEGKPPAAQTKFFTLWSTIKERFIPHNLFLTISLAAVYFFCATRRYIEAIKNKDINTRLFEEVFLYVFLVGVSQLLISILGAGDADLGKHVFMFNVSFDFVLVYSLMLLIKENLDKGASKK